jgi:hypothetical protein
MSAHSWGYLLVTLPVMLACAAYLAWHARPYSEAKRRMEGERWARRHQAYVDARWVGEVDDCLQRDRRVRMVSEGSRRSSRVAC